MAVNVPLVSVASSDLDIWLGLDFQTNIPSYWIGLSPIRQLSITTKIYTLAPLGLSCWNGHCCGSWTPYPERTIDFFSLLETCITPFHPMRVIPEGGGFSVSSKSVPPSFQFNVCGILCNTVSFSNTGGYPVAKAVTSILGE